MVYIAKTHCLLHYTCLVTILEVCVLACIFVIVRLFWPIALVLVRNCGVLNAIVRTAIVRTAIVGNALVRIAIVRNSGTVCVRVASGVVVGTNKSKADLPWNCMAVVQITTILGLQRGTALTHTHCTTVLQ